MQTRLIANIIIWLTVAVIACSLFVVVWAGNSVLRNVDANGGLGKTIGRFIGDVKAGMGEHR